MTPNSLDPEIRLAVEAAQDKQALDISVLNLRGSGAFADYFLLCSGSSQPQIQAIAEGIEEKLGRQGRHVAHREGKSSAEWVLLDYGYFVVHIFSERARQYYDLERLWRNAERVDFHEPVNPAAQSGRTKSHAGSHNEPRSESEGNATQQ
ncbi:MAG: ribosome silencing factor [Candidatus Acidiferrales bacterium]